MGLAKASQYLFLAFQGLDWASQDLAGLSVHLSVCPFIHPPRPEPGIGGPSQAQGSSSQAMGGPIQALGDPSQALEGKSQALEGLSQA